MVFSTLSFLFIFLPAVLAAYFIIPRRYRMAKNIVLLLFSLAFYAYGEPWGVFIMLASIGGNYALARLAGQDIAARRKLGFIGAIVFNLAILGFFKYAGFALSTVNAVFGSSIPLPQITMPIGISFFTFQGMSYVFDVYQGTCRAQRNILHVATYISLFPQLVAGPIVRYNTIAAELVERHESLDKIAQGIRRFLTGLGKKVLLANATGLIANQMFNADVAWLSAPAAWLGMVAYTFQIYYDFSGYSDMAIGLGLMFGFTFPENFKYPYISQSITEFWHRWHISLGRWFRDYVYFPLGGNRKGLQRQLFNVAMVWCLTGLWHGAAWNFVLWGAYFAVILIVEKLFLGDLLRRAWRPLRHIYALLLLIFGRVIFISDSMTYFWQYLKAMFGQSLGQETGSTLFLLGENAVLLLVALLFCVPLADVIPARLKDKPFYPILRDIAMVAVFFLSIMSIVKSSFNPFIYFRF